MRLHLVLKSKDDIVLPIHYNKCLQDMIYYYIDDKKFYYQLKTNGFNYNNKSLKLFTFSKIMGQYQIDKINNNIKFTKTIKLIISSPVKYFIESVAKGILKNHKNILLDNNNLFLSDMEFEVREQFNTTHIIEMMTPLVTYKTKEKKTIFISPFDADFEKYINNNIKIKMNILNNNNEDYNIKITPQFLQSEKFMKIQMFGDIIIKGWIGRYEISSTPDTIQIAYYSGLGSKNSMGFGMFRIIDTKE
ncbi:CRISPR-associated endoribonuclease Cas6 [Caldicellulosiruptoraceae bacterium PP1]